MNKEGKIECDFCRHWFAGYWLILGKVYCLECRRKFKKDHKA